MLDVRDGPLGFTGNQTILYNEAAMPQNHENDQTEKQYLIKVSYHALNVIHNGHFLVGGLVKPSQYMGKCPVYQITRLCWCS